MRKAGRRRRDLIRWQKEAAAVRHSRKPKIREGPADLEARAVSEPLPDLYGETRLVLMAVDPYLVHAYWEVTDADLKKAQESLGREGGEPRPVLRFHDITCIDFDGTNAHSRFDVEIELRPRNWYVRLWSADKTYCVDLGLTAGGGRFAPVVRSNILRVPRAEPSSRFEELFWKPGGPAMDPVLGMKDELLPEVRHPAELQAGHDAIPETLPEVERKAPLDAVEPPPPAARDDSCSAAVLPTVASPDPDTPRDRAGKPDPDRVVPDGLTGTRDLSLECERQFLPGISSN